MLIIYDRRQLKTGHYQVTNLSIEEPSIPDHKPVKILTKFEGDGDPGYLNTCCMFLLASYYCNC